MKAGKELRKVGKGKKCRNNRRERMWEGRKEGVECFKACEREKRNIKRAAEEDREKSSSRR